MASPGPYHARLGQSWRNALEPCTCSKCGATIPPEAVPLQLFSETSNLAWRYCDKCGWEIMRDLIAERERQKKKKAN